MNKTSRTIYHVKMVFKAHENGHHFERYVIKRDLPDLYQNHFNTKEEATLAFHEAKRRSAQYELVSATLIETTTTIIESDLTF